MKFFLDTEFIERGAGYPIELISIGIVSAAGWEFYAVSSEFNEDHASAWVKENVLPNLGNSPRIPNLEIAQTVKNWVMQCSTVGTSTYPPEFWGYYADYDWVVFCQLFGTMLNLPTSWPMYCRDLKQWSDQLGAPNFPKQGIGEHNALADARWNLDLYRYLSDYAMGITKRNECDD